MLNQALSESISEVLMLHIIASRGPLLAEETLNHAIQAAAIWRTRSQTARGLIRNNCDLQ